VLWWLVSVQNSADNERAASEARPGAAVDEGGATPPRLSSCGVAISAPLGSLRRGAYRVGFAPNSATYASEYWNNKTHVSLVTLLWICQRQAFVALDSLASRQAYQAWLLLRPGIESVLIMGKWVEDVANFHVWQNRFSSPKKYRKKYSGRALASRVLPRSAEIQKSLSTINDHFVHPNFEYYMRHTRVAERENRSVQVTLRFFEDDEFHWASVLGMLHLLIVIQQSLSMMFADTFVNVEVGPEGYGLEQFERLHWQQALEVAGTGTTASMIIHDIGLWSRRPNLN
jgi:hypothetical protein